MYDSRQLHTCVKLPGTLALLAVPSALVQLSPFYHLSNNSLPLTSCTWETIPGPPHSTCNRNGMGLGTRLDKECYIIRSCMLYSFGNRYSRRQKSSHSVSILWSFYSVSILQITVWNHCYAHVLYTVFMASNVVKILNTYTGYTLLLNVFSELC